MTLVSGVRNSWLMLAKEFRLGAIGGLRAIPRRDPLLLEAFALGNVAQGRSMTDFPVDRVLFEVVSAFATVGLSTGITADLPPAAHWVLILLMFVGRVGTITVAAALALRARHVPYRYP